MQVLSIGSRGAEVMFLQRLLNKHGANPYVTEDGAFGPRTQSALIAYQRAHRVTAPPLGVAGPATWQSFGRLTERRHRVTPGAQPTGMSCWSAAATIMLGNQSVGPGHATLQPGGGLRVDLPNVETFIRGLGWRLINNQSAPPAMQLILAITQAPAWVAFQGTHLAHAVVFSGVLSDGAPDGTGTVFLVQDPWPPGGGTGTAYGTTYLGQTVFLRSVQPAQAAMIAYVAQR